MEDEQRNGGMMRAAFGGFACGVFLAFFTMWMNDGGSDTAHDYEVTVWKGGVPYHFKAEHVHLRGGVLTWEGGAAGPDAPFELKRGLGALNRAREAQPRDE